MVATSSARRAVGPWVVAQVSGIIVIDRPPGARVAPGARAGNRAMIHPRAVDVAGPGATRWVAPTWPRGPVAGGLGAIIGSFKCAATRGINESCGTSGQTVWQRNYHEHIVRDEDELDRIREYIADNPARWALDRENPAANLKEPGCGG